MKEDGPETHGTNPPAKRVPRDKDGLFKKRGWWQYRLRIDGRWRQFSTGTKSYAEAKRIRREALQQHEDGTLPADDSRQRFDQAIPIWLEERKALKARSTWKTETFLAKPLVEAFGSKRLCDIRNDDLRRYQTERIKEVSPGTVNRELRILRAILKQKRLWRRLQDDYEQLREPKSAVGKALTVEEQQQLFRVASSEEHWKTAYLAGLLAVNTTARGCELKALRLRDVDLAEDQLYIRRSKTDAGHRTIPLNATAKWAAARLLERA